MNNLKYINIGGVLEGKGQGSTGERLGVSQKMGYYPRGIVGVARDKDWIGSRNSMACELS